MSVIHSTAFPPGAPQQQHSQVHQLLRQATQIDEEVVLRPFQAEDLGKINQLNLEWFPVKYGEAFYNRMRTNPAVKCWVAECGITLKHGKKKRVIIGAIIYEFTAVDGSVLAKESWMEFIASNLCALYIMTLGVIDEFRGKGVATMLLNKVMEEANVNQQVRYVNLHVIVYNSACRFYQRNAFEKLSVLPAYYTITGVDYDAVHYARFVNGGRRREGWLEWFKGFFN